MDKALYVAMTGARASLQAQGTLSHNLANSDTPGFKEALANTEAFPIRGQGFASRVDALHVDAGFNRTAGAQHITGKPLDLSLQTGTWLAVQSSDGLVKLDKVAYVRFASVYRSFKDIREFGEEIARLGDDLVRDDQVRE
mgnify:CR=1 FL=1